VYRNPKVGRLTDKQFRFWISCLCLCSENGGPLPDDRDIAYHLRVEPSKVAVLVGSLRDARLIDEGPSGFFPHNWRDRQFASDDVNQRVKKHREAKRNVTETLQFENVTPSDTDTDTEQKQIHKEPVPADGGYDVWFEIFWPDYWRRTAKAAGKKALAKHATSEEKRALIRAAMLAQKPGYERRDTEKRPYLSTWANQERFKDEPELFEYGSRPAPPAGPTEAMKLAEKDFQEYRKKFGETA